ncbi:hypothetical protein [Sideroxydans sp.]
MATRQWTQAQRVRQAKLIHKWKPWKKSTGAKTPGGKAITSKNAVNFSIREDLRALRRENKKILALMDKLHAMGLL